MPRLSLRSLLIASLITTVCAAHAQVRVVPSYEEQQRDSAPKPQVVQIGVPFDAEEARHALGPGNAVIGGDACSWYDNLMYRAVNTTIYLVPETNYARAWLSARERAKQMSTKKLKVLPETFSQEAFAIRIDTTTDEYGRFQFPDVKPGRYILIIRHNFNQPKYRDVLAGQTYGSYGTSAKHYRREDYTVLRDDTIIMQVEVKAENEKVKVQVLGGDRHRQSDIFKRRYTHC